MKRAEVWRSPLATRRPWQVDINECGPRMDRLIGTTGHATYTDALEHALAEVGLTEKNTEKEN